MKKVLLILSLAVVALASCEEKSTKDKLIEAGEAVKEDVEDAGEETGGKVKDGLKDLKEDLEK
jgi:hypothetical protein